LFHARNEVFFGKSVEFILSYEFSALKWWVGGRWDFFEKAAIPIHRDM